MNIREPLVYVTYYYLREAPGDSPSRRAERHEAFVADVRRVTQSVTGWLSMPLPDLPAIPLWEQAPPADVFPIMRTGQLQGRINASASITASVLRNMFLLSVAVGRTGDYDTTAWSMLDASLGDSPMTPHWLHTTRYWCGMAPRPPEELEQDRSIPIKAPFGVLCLGHGALPHLLVYPDARTENRASLFLKTLALQLDWYTVQARYRLEEYENRASRASRSQQHALEQVAQNLQDWGSPDSQNRLRSLMPLQAQLDMLESTYEDVLSDMTATKYAAQELRTLMGEYRLTLMESGLWDAAPTLWEARAAYLSSIQQRIEGDVTYIDSSLRRMDVMIRGLQTRIALLQSERERLLVYLLLAIGLAVLAVMIADTSLTHVAMRLLALVIVAGIVFAAWQSWLRSRIP